MAQVANAYVLKTLSGSLLLTDGQTLISAEVCLECPESLKGDLKSPQLALIEFAQNTVNTVNFEVTFMRGHVVEDDS